MQFITTHTSDRIFEIVLNRPDKRNALNSEFVSELISAFTNADVDENTRVVILKANGKVFSAGADLGYLQQLQKNTYEENLEDSTQLAELFKKIYFHKKLIIAQVEGHAIAGGCGLATVCDFVFAVPEAKFGYTEVKIGFVPAIVMFFLLRKIGEAKARELLLTGKLIDAQQAKETSGLLIRLLRQKKLNSTPGLLPCNWQKKLPLNLLPLPAVCSLKYNRSPKMKPWLMPPVKMQLREARKIAKRG